MVHQRKGAPWGIRPVGQAVKTPASHAGNAGSIPARVTNFPHRLTRNRTREGFGRVRKARSGFPAKGAQQLAASRADCKAGCRFPHGSPISLAWRLEARLSFSQAEPDGEFCEAKLVRSVPKGPILRHQLSPHLTQTSGALRLLIIQPVIMTLRIHLFPFRTQKLSSAVPKILGG